MILNSISLCDFRSYGGLHEISLTPRVKRGAVCPIVLFGGLNGAGKTTLLLAVKLALYGRQALGIGTTKIAYEKFVRECIHISPNALIKPNSSYVELDFTYGKLGRRVSYKVRRNWYFDGKTLQEGLKLWEDGEELISLSYEACQGFLNELIPVGVSELFFFDGEKIAELAEDETGGALGDAIRRLVGLDLVERLRNDLRVFLLRSEATLAGNSIGKEMASLESEYTALRSQIREDRSALKVATAKFDELQAERDHIETRLTERGGEWGLSRQDQKAKASSLAEDIKQDARKLRDELNGAYPLTLAADLLETIVEESSAIIEGQRIEQSNAALSKFAKSLKKRFKGSSNKDTRNAIGQMLAGALQPISESNALIDLSLREIGQLEHTVYHTLASSKRHVTDLGEKIDQRSDELDTISLQIERAPDEETLASDLAALKKLNERIADAQAEVAVRTRELKARYNEAIDLARTLRRKHEGAAERSDLDRPLEYATKARQLLKDFGRINAKRKVKQLEVEFAEAFQRLARKDDIAVKATIDPVKFTVKLINRNGDEINKSQLSAGEKQIYAIAMLEALAKTSGRRLPVIIDTPLGRLDSRHRANLVEHYFPHASHQVILLSTDTEVDQIFYKSLSPSISHAFEIIFDEENNSSDLHEGYFWRQTLKEAV